MLQKNIKRIVGTAVSPSFVKSMILTIY